LDAIRLTNVTLGKVTRNKFPIEDNALDGALIAFYLNGAKQPVKVLEEAKRCLRRGGWLCVLEWVKRDEPVGPPVAQRMSVAELRSMLEEAGFRFTSRHDLNNRQYMLIMRK
jgi:ubiquinone/menaquinone biosynthesis C-methylase UbiE